MKRVFCVGNTLSCVLLMSLTMLLIGCKGEQQPQTMPMMSYKTMTISPVDRTLESAYTATIQGKQHVEIRPQVNGLITRICINEGAVVRKGETLFIIDQVPYRAALETALANVKSAEAKLANAALVQQSQQELFNANVVAEYDLQKARNSHLEAQAALAQAKAQELNARNNLSYTEVKSPVDGAASMIPYHIGALVSSSIAEPLVTVSDDAQMFAYFSMTESQVLDLVREGGTLQDAMKKMPDVLLHLSDGSVYQHSGKIDAISGTVDPATGAVVLRAIFPNPEKILRNGGNGRVIVPTHRADCIAIPKGATYELQNRVFVYKVVDGKAQSTPVSVLSIDNGTEYIVESGLASGDVIIAEGAGLVREGTPVSSDQPQEK